MKKIYLMPAALTLALLATACSTTPTTTSLLERTRSDYVSAQHNPNVTTYAQVEMKDAGEALERANAASNHDESAEQVDKLAYLAKQKIAVAQEAGTQRAAEADIAKSAQRRDQIRLEQRTNEADQARAHAAQSQRATDAALGDVADAQRRTADTQARLDQRTSEAARANANAEQSQRTADAALGEAAEAQRKTTDAQIRSIQLEAQLEDLAARQTDRGMVITLGDVLFETDHAHLNPNGMHTVQKLADILKQNPQRSVLIEGYTDSTGSVPHNQELSERRATTVRSALEDMGVAHQRVAVHGYGQTYPVAANDTSENRQLNRRVEIVLSDDSGKITQR